MKFKFTIGQIRKRRIAKKMKLKKLKKKKNCKIFISDLPGRANKYMLSVPHPNFSDIFEERKIVPDLVYRIQRRDIKEGVVTKTLKKKK